MAGCTLIMTFSLTENGYCTPFPWLPVRGLTSLSGDFGSSYKKEDVSEGQQGQPNLWCGIGMCTQIIKPILLILLTRNVLFQQVVTLVSTSSETNLNMTWTRAGGADTLSDLVILVRPTCSPLCLLSRNDPECNCLIRSSRLKAAAAALNAVTNINDDESPTTKFSMNLESHRNYSRPNVTTQIHPSTWEWRRGRGNTWKNHRNTLIGVQVTPPFQTYRGCEP